MYYLFGLLILLCLVLFTTGLYFFNHAIKRNVKLSLQEKSFLQDIFINLSKNVEWLNKQSLENIQISSFDSLNLYGKLLKTKAYSNQVIILVHGYMSRGEDMAGFARLFYETYGFNVLMPDLRGHGKSEGNYIGFGWHDRLDIIQWIDDVIHRFGEEVEIVLLGISMGGATVCMASGEDLPKNVKFIISDCAYDSIENILAYQTKHKYKLPKFPLLNVTNLFIKTFAKYDLNDGKVYEYVKKAKVPILFIHGDNDHYVPTKMVYHLYENAHHDKELLIVKGASHGDAYDTNPIAYQNSIKSFINKYMS